MGQQKADEEPREKCILIETLTGENFEHFLKATMKVTENAAYCNSIHDRNNSGFLSIVYTEILATRERSDENFNRRIEC